MKLTAMPCAALLALTLASAALANGRFPATNQILTRPGRTSELALRTTFGLLRSDDGGATWDWVCEKAIGYSGTMDPPLAWHANGTLVAGLFDGLALTREGACAWSQDPVVGKQVVVDVSLADSSGGRLDALTGSYDPASPPGQPAYVSAIWSSDAAARVWTQTSTRLPADVIVESFDRAATDARRLYVTGESEAGGMRVGVFLRSDDGGQTWSRRAFPFDANGERSLFLAAIDPNRAQRLYVRTGGADAGRVLVSDDGGESFRMIWSGAQPQGFALSADGARVWVGTFREGLARAQTSDFTFSTVNRTPIACLHYAGNALFACSLDAYGFAAARSDDYGATFVPLLTLAKIRGPRACGEDAAANPCLAEWPIVKATVGIEDTVDAGPLPVFDAGSARPSERTATCGCAIVTRRETRNATDAGLLAAASVALASLCRRRRARISP